MQRVHDHELAASLISQMIPRSGFRGASHRDAGTQSELVGLRVYIFCVAVTAFSQERVLQTQPSDVCVCVCVCV